MTNTIALFLALIIVGFFALDHFVLGWGAPQLILRELIPLIKWMAFWR